MIPTSQVQLALAEAGSEPASYGPPITLSNGAFNGSVPRESLPSGAYALWARACIGTVCDERSAPVTLA